MRDLCGRVLMLTCALALSASPASAGKYPPERHGFMIGFGLGGGSAALKGGDREGGVTANLRAGYAVRPDLVLQYEGAAWTRTFEQSFSNGVLNASAVDFTWSFSTNAAALTYYPPGSGLFLRGGIGFGTARVQVKTGGVKLSDDETGFGFLIAGGWEFRLTQKFALAPQIEYAYQTLDILESSDFVDFGLGFNWYW